MLVRRGKTVGSLSSIMDLTNGRGDVSGRCKSVGKHTTRLVARLTDPPGSATGRLRIREALKSGVKLGNQLWDTGQTDMAAKCRCRSTKQGGCKKREEKRQDQNPIARKRERERERKKKS